MLAKTVFIWESCKYASHSYSLPDVFLSGERALNGVQADNARTLEFVAATLIDARCALEEIETPDREIDRLHGEITRAHAMCSQVMANLRSQAQSASAGG